MIGVCLYNWAPGSYDVRRLADKWQAYVIGQFASDPRNQASSDPHRIRSLYSGRPRAGGPGPARRPGVLASRADELGLGWYKILTGGNPANVTLDQEPPGP